ncbi:MAG: DUF4307 domain-containing protein [Actinomycetota bacterium]|nr:DUF4307 domain-containing protein [Actinomycetota bacterium]
MTDQSTRYGTSTRRPWLFPVIAAVGITLGIVWAVWAATADKPFSARLYGYEVISDHKTTVKLDIHLPKPRELECTVQAQAEDHSVIGERTITIPSSARKAIRTTTNITTERRAVTGVLKGCIVRD